MTANNAEYCINEHRHRYALWCASRAAQRGFAGTDVIVPVLEKTGIKEKLESICDKELTAAEFDNYHREWCRFIVANLKSKKNVQCTYGRAAKLVAIYIKTVIIVGHSPDSDLAQVAHPPIDAILLNSLAGEDIFTSEEKRQLKSIRWTQLDETGYFDLITKLQRVLSKEQPWWKIEEFWRAA